MTKDTLILGKENSLLVAASLDNPAINHRTEAHKIAAFLETALHRETLIELVNELSADLLFK